MVTKQDAAQYWHTWKLLLMPSDKESDTCNLCLQLCKSFSCTARTDLRTPIKTGLRTPNEHTMVGLHGKRFSCLKLCTKTTNELHSLALKRKLDRLTTNGFAPGKPSDGQAFGGRTTDRMQATQTTLNFYRGETMRHAKVERASNVEQH